MTEPIAVRDTGIDLVPDSSRVVARYFIPGREEVGPGHSRGEAVLDRIKRLTESDVEQGVAAVLSEFSGRLRQVEQMFLDHADRAVGTAPLSRARRLFIGAAFTHEYSVEAAALCNPSAVPFGDVAPDGAQRFVMSVRCIGEGHRSSIGFRTGSVAADGTVRMDEPGSFPQLASTDTSTIESSTYRVTFPAETEISERVLWPRAAVERGGMEDTRFVRFVDDDGVVTFYGTYTAFDGDETTVQMLTTGDFRSFEAAPLVGAAAANKGLAVFPRKVGGRYAALSRSDRESNWIAFSDDVHRWDASEQIQVPERTWEVLQIGNCGPPIETDAGWLVVTHGVGPMRRYSLGFLLLDLHEPRRVLARSLEPVITTGPGRNGGYVPNVVYTCGGFAHGDTLVLPYGIGDQHIAVATMSVREVIGSLK